ncbi:MAG: ATP-binding protein [bacterium]|nr:ATP-binding protein [bacterium]
MAPGRALLIFGPRRIGKTTLLCAYLKTRADKRVVSFVGDDILVREIFGSEDRTRILSYVAAYDIIAIDEAQLIPNIGRAAKMIVDAYPEKRLILTGSSSFELYGQVGEPLTGRHFSMALIPLAQDELGLNRLELLGGRSDFLVYGAYPEVLTADDHESKKRLLRELVSSYLFRDILTLNKVKSPKLAIDTARALAYQIGSEVSLSEIARLVKTDHKTVARYIDVLEKMFIIKRVGGFSRNMRNEITKKSKYYFLDLGVRNAVIENFNPIGARDDVGALWENFVFMELYKKSVIADRTGDRFYFWRTHTGQEIDIIREREGVLLGIESKWRKKSTVPKTWRTAYPNAEFLCITTDNFFDTLERIG